MGIFHLILKPLKGPKFIKGQWFVYLLECSDGSLYCGSTNDLDKRVKDHNTGTGGKYTRPRTPVKLVYFKKYVSKSAALKREYEVKSWSRKKKIDLVTGSRGEIWRGVW